MQRDAPMCIAKIIGGASPPIDSCSNFYKYTMALRLAFDISYVVYIIIEYSDIIEENLTSPLRDAPCT